jgi:UDP-N-acetylmuramate dehydrogenase
VIEALEKAGQAQLPYFILGKGSNCLFDDAGFYGLVIQNRIDYFRPLPEGIFEVGAGFSFPLLGVRSARAGWSGLEFASGIPGTVGGAIAMNAGANGQETSQWLTSIEVVTPSLERRIYRREEVDFGYRTSPFQHNGEVIVGATFALKSSSQARSLQLSMLEKRQKSQPLSEKSAGCIFRNPLGTSAGALIDQSGLKNSQIGQARVSSMHANFIVNLEAAKACDVRSLVKEIKQRVKEVTGYDLEEEVKYINPSGGYGSLSS